MNADERGLENPKPIVWKPTPDMYRMDTPEGREAYEAAFGMKIKTESSLRAKADAGGGRAGEKTPPPGAAVPQEHAQPYANLG